MGSWCCVCICDVKGGREGEVNVTMTLRIMILICEQPLKLQLIMSAHLSVVNLLSHDQKRVLHCKY